MNARPLILLAALWWCPAALAQDDGKAIPYDPLPDDESPRPRKLPRWSDRTEDRPIESDYEERDREQRLAGFDEANKGLGLELTSGLLLQDSARGALVEPRFSYGARFTWEFGRALFSDETARRAWFADVGWSSASAREGTEAIFAESHAHYFSVAPAFGFSLAGEGTYQLYVQAGGGLALQWSALHVEGTEQQISGIKPLLQYGLGFRGQPSITDDDSMRLSFRVELTRFRRGYMDDTLVGASLGLLF